MVYKILVVDDEPDVQLLINTRFRKQIKERIFEFIYALNGVDALAKLEEHKDTEIILSDIRMPIMDGFTLLKKFNHPNSLIKIILKSL